MLRLLVVLLIVCVVFFTATRFVVSTTSHLAPAQGNPAQFCESTPTPYFCTPPPVRIVPT